MIRPVGRLGRMLSATGKQQTGRNEPDNARFTRERQTRLHAPTVPT